MCVQVARYAGGRVGLQNLGNSCYLNAVVQCLAHTPPLKLMLTSRAYRADINMTNTLGKKGQVATTFAELVDALSKV